MTLPQVLHGAAAAGLPSGFLAGVCSLFTAAARRSDACNLSGGGPKATDNKPRAGCLSSGGAGRSEPVEDRELFLCLPKRMQTEDLECLVAHRTTILPSDLAAHRRLPVEGFAPSPPPFLTGNLIFHDTKCSQWVSLIYATCLFEAQRFIPGATYVDEYWSIFI